MFFNSALQSTLQTRVSITIFIIQREEKRSKYLLGCSSTPLKVIGTSQVPVFWKWSIRLWNFLLGKLESCPSSLWVEGLDLGAEGWGCSSDSDCHLQYLATWISVSCRINLYCFHQGRVFLSHQQQHGVEILWLHKMFPVVTHTGWALLAVQLNSWKVQLP